MPLLPEGTSTWRAGGGLARTCLCCSCQATVFAARGHPHLDHYCATHTQPRKHGRPAWAAGLWHPRYGRAGGGASVTRRLCAGLAIRGQAWTGMSVFIREKHGLSLIT
jgi:hypothetical protein